MEEARSDLLPCAPEVPSFDDFNPKAKIPYGVSVEHVYQRDARLCRVSANSGYGACEEGHDATGRHADACQLQQYGWGIHYQQSPAPLSDNRKECVSQWASRFASCGEIPENAAQHAGADGIEVKASRYLRGWQGHNPEDVWLMVFVFESGRPSTCTRPRNARYFDFMQSMVGCSQRPIGNLRGGAPQAGEQSQQQFCHPALKRCQRTGFI